MKTVRTITINVEQIEKVKEKGINLSKFVRWAIENKLEEYLENNKKF